MAEAADEIIDVPDLIRKSRVSGSDGVTSGDIVRETVESTVTRAVVSTGNDLMRNAAGDFYSTGSNRLQTILASGLTTVLLKSPAQQYGLGLATGWVSGYLFRKVSRTAAFVVGCGFLAAQGATAMGIVTIDWNKMKSVAVTGMQRLESRIMPPDNERVSIMDKIMFIFHTHIYVSSGFLSGVIVGLTF